MNLKHINETFELINNFQQKLAYNQVLVSLTNVKT